MATLNRDPAEGLNAAVAAELRAERAAQGVSIADLGDRSGISKSTLLRLLNEKRLIGMEALNDIATALGVRATTIVGRAERRLAGEDALPPAPHPDRDGEAGSGWGLAAQDVEGDAADEDEALANP